jgi:hypothetical protein
MNGVNGNTQTFPIAESAPAYHPRFTFLSVETTRTSAQLTWSRAGSETRYLVFAQEIYGVHFTKEDRFELEGLEPRKTYNVFVLAEKRGPEWIAFTSFETLG